VEGPCQRVEVLQRILLYVEVELVGDPAPVIIQSPEKVEENIYEKEKKYDLLEATDEITAVEFLPENGSK